MAYITRVDNSTRKGVFKSTFITTIVTGIIFCFIGWMIGLTGGNVKYSDSEKNRLNLLGGRLGVGVAIGFFWGIILSIGLMVNGIRDINVLSIICSVLAFPTSIWLGISCIKKYNSQLKTIVERNAYNPIPPLFNIQEEIKENNLINDNEPISNTTNFEEVPDDKKVEKKSTSKHVIIANKKRDNH